MAVATSSTVTISNSLFVKNTIADGVNGGGGAINQLVGDLTVTNSQFSSNVSSNNGGAIYFFGNSLNVTASTFDNNNANDAGDIYVLPSQLSNLINDTFVGNVARTQGGALDVHNFGTVILANDTITGNTAATGGGVAVLQQSISAVLLENDIVALNTAPTSPDIATLAFIIEDAGGNFIGNLSGGWIPCRYPDRQSQSWFAAK